jgi:dolichol-phosphate mannosyltransferase
VAPSLACVGFKVMLDIVLAAGPALRVAEVPLVFGFRERGDSKLSPRVVWDYAMMLAEHRMRGALSAAALSAAAVALVGLHANLFTLWLLADLYGAGLTAAQTSGALAACVTIYAVTEALAYRRRGSWRWYLGLPPFIASCAFGILANVLLTSWLSAHGAAWPLAGALGAAFGMAWNYGAIGRHGWKR